MSEPTAGFAGGEFAGGGGDKRRSGNRKLSVSGRMFLCLPPSFPLSGAKFQCIYKSTRKTRIFSKKMKKLLAIPKEISYTNNCCDMIAMKREVAARVAGFPWSECQVRKLTTSHCTETEDHEMVENNVCEIE